LSCGLLKKSFVPPVEQRDLRDLTRGRTSLIQDRARVANRIQKVLEDANLKLGSVASDILGASGRDMLAALVSGEQDAHVLAQLARRRMRAKLPELAEALHGQVRDHHRFLLGSLLAQIDGLEAQIEAYSRRIDEVMDPFFKEAVERLDTMPGVDQRAAECLVAEIGIDMSRFATAGHLCSWAGICPGNRRSAGKRKSGRMNPANVWLKAILCQTGWAASHTKDTYLSTQYSRLARRRGRKRAIMAVGHSQLQSAYYMLRDRVPYADLGVNWLDERHGTQHAKYLVHRLEKLGYQVDIQKASAAA
jgi:transposase